MFLQVEYFVPHAPTSPGPPEPYIRPPFDTMEDRTRHVFLAMFVRVRACVCKCTCVRACVGRSVRACVCVFKCACVRVTSKMLKMLWWLPARQQGNRK